MSEYIKGDRVCSKDRGCYYRIPGTIQGKPLAVFSDETTYIVTLDNGQIVEMPGYMLDTPTEDDIAIYQAKLERDAEYERQRLAKIERKRQRQEEHDAELDRRRQDKQDQKQADIEAKRMAHQNKMRKQNARVFGLQSLER